MRHGGKPAAGNGRPGPQPLADKHPAMSEGACFRLCLMDMFAMHMHATLHVVHAIWHAAAGPSALMQPPQVFVPVCA